MTENWLPEAPELHGELILDVFTHPSLRLGGAEDNERYAALGEKVLEAAITHCIFLRYPGYHRHEIEEERSKQLSDQNFEQWTSFYRFRDKLRYAASAAEEVNSLQGARDLFHAYIGGVYTQVNGPMTVNSWVFFLVVPPEERAKLETKVPALCLPPPPSHTYPMAPPPPPPGFHPRSRTNSTSSSKNVVMSLVDPSGAPLQNAPAGKAGYLLRFNEITTQRRMNVQYPAEQMGLQHAPRWVVKCLVGGTELGHGVGTTKQLAKEDAAKQAFHAMKFHLSP